MRDVDQGSGKLGASKLKAQVEAMDLARAMNQAIASTRSPVKSSSNPTGELGAMSSCCVEACNGGMS